MFKILHTYINAFGNNTTNFSFQKLFTIIGQNRYSLNGLILDLQKILQKFPNKIILSNNYSTISHNFIKDYPELPLLSSLESEKIMSKLYSKVHNSNISNISDYSEVDIVLLKIIYSVAPDILESSSFFKQ